MRSGSVSAVLKCLSDHVGASVGDIGISVMRSKLSGQPRAKNSICLWPMPTFSPRAAKVSAESDLMPGSVVARIHGCYVNFVSLVI